MVQGCEDFDQLGIRAGTALWLGPLEGGVMPFTVSAHPAGSEAQAAARGKKVIRVEPEESEVVRGLGRGECGHVGMPQLVAMHACYSKGRFCCLFVWAGCEGGGHGACRQPARLGTYL